MADCEVEGTIASPLSIPPERAMSPTGKGETKEGTSELDRIRWDRKRGRRASAKQRRPFGWMEMGLTQAHATRRLNGTSVGSITVESVSI
ncbi:hypothetical protein TNCV_1062921 [Trichonephila clavipes]|nr:hypothetical protein TNCV_1062921 [Trichonephila clavipes]